jgi:hypothetical protein
MTGKNDIALPTAYTQIKSLLSHPPCSHCRNPSTWPCHACEATFTTKYWSCAATLLDYFADFYPTDTPLMQSIWFYLLDIWQESALYLPYETVLEDAEVASAVGAAVWGADRAMAFEKNVRDTLTLFEVTIWGRRQHTGDQVIYDPRGEAWNPVGEYETGPWISGVKPWAQFLENGGVGVAPPFTGAVDVAAAATKEKEKDEKEKRIITRYVPSPAIGIIKFHTQRAHTLATDLFHTQDQALLTSSIADFQARTLPLPSRGESHVYMSRFTGRETSYTMANGAPPVMRYVGLGDPQLNLRGIEDWNLLDECVASCKGVAAYVPVSGGGDADEDEDGNGDEEEDEDEDVFDMWTVVEKRIGEEDGEALLDLGDMFDTWCGVDEG